MTAIMIFVGIVAVLIAVIVLAAVPVRHAEAVASGFTWYRSVQIDGLVWVKRKSRQKPSGEVRNLKVRHAYDDDRRRYTYQTREWRKKRTVSDSGRSQASARWPQYELGKDEKFRERHESYTATFTSEDGRDYTANVPFDRWESLEEGAGYRLGRSAFGSVRTFTPVRPLRNH